MTDIITINMPRSWAEQAMNLLDALSYDENYDYDGCFQHWADYAKPETLASQLRAALEQPQVQSGGIPPNWKLVPVEPTKDMKAAGAFAAMDQVRRSYNPPSAYIPVDSMALLSYRAMLAAAPQPPVVEQPQGEQEPVAWQYRMRPDWGSKKDCWGPWQDCTKEQAAMYQRVPLLHDWAYESRQLYTHPQPQREPLTEADLYDIAGNYFADEWAQKQAVMMLKDHGIRGEA